MSLDNTLLTMTIASVLNSALDLATVSVPLSKQYSIGLPNGTGASQADKIFHDTRTLAPSATEDLDLAGGLTDALGATLTFARIKALIVAAASGNTNNVLVGGAAANQFTNWVADVSDKITVRPGGLFVLAAPDATAYAVTGGTGDLLRIGNSAGSTSVTYDIIIIGASA